MLASELAISHVYDALFGWSKSRRQSAEHADTFARKAILIDRADAMAYSALGFVAHTNCAHDNAVDAFTTALDLNDNLAEAHGYLAMTLGFVGDIVAVEHHVDRAVRLSPHDPMLAFWFDAAAMAAYMARKYEPAFTWAKRSVAENPEYIGGLRVLAAACGQLGRVQKANETVGAMLALDPTLTCSRTSEQLPFRSTADAYHYSQGLRAAGLS
jgi:tetratricopeptide (TPR) repeat protein